MVRTFERLVAPLLRWLDAHHGAARLTLHAPAFPLGVLLYAAWWLSTNVSFLFGLLVAAVGLLGLAVYFRVLVERAKRDW